ncbi:MAG: bifunctional pyr operon transcriptional regulator/uracil phosphoribosyltransferase PyrR [Betaproteobacteria bacterium]|nr:MAG: bifunctional pyr operon transcriptional regulator/uracil phosphoribosyltransferase PyrR [Betaproteobacteria bacterium]
MTPILPDPESLCAELVRQLQPQVTADTALVGIHTGGAWLAERLHSALGIALPLGLLDISFYRDDFDKTGLHPQIKPTQIPFEVNGRHIVLVDDVLYTGRTVRGAMNELFDYGRPASISLAVLIDRGGRQLPVAAQFVGARLEVPPARMLVLERDENGKLRLKLDA